MEANDSETKGREKQRSRKSIRFCHLDPEKNDQGENDELTLMRSRQLDRSNRFHSIVATLLNNRTEQTRHFSHLSIDRDEFFVTPSTKTKTIGPLGTVFIRRFSETKTTFEFIRLFSNSQHIFNDFLQSVLRCKLTREKVNIIN